ncbi:MAG TPA: membrane protein insertase YidC [Kofleriaceae bacterium]|nr:membrane protein insertase YidC [Kofleriaceae bacterium]
MQDQGKRLIIAVALMLGVLWLWQSMFAKKDDASKKPAQGSAAVQKQAATGGVPMPQVVAYDPAPAGTPAKEETITLSFPKVVVELTNAGGMIKGWKLTDPRMQHDATKGELVPQKDSAGEFLVGFAKGSTFKLPAQQMWQGKQTSPTQVVYTLKTDNLELTKTFDVEPDAYFVRCTVSVKTKADAHERLVVSTYGFQNAKTDVTGSSRIQPRIWQSSTDRDGTVVSTNVTSLLDPKDGGPRYETNFRWTGFEHPYILMGFAGKQVQGIEKHTYAEGTEGLMRTDIVLPDSVGGVQAEMVSYMGPKSWAHLSKADAAAGFTTHFKDVIDFGWFGFIGRPLLWLLLQFQKVVGNWGIAIILLTVLVKLVTLPFVTKSMRSMKTMSLLAPQLKSLNEKYKGDKARIQQETMAVYKDYGVNPLTGCLPMFLQMPIWIALYRMLSNAGELYQQPFIPGWIGDLTAADPNYVLPVVLCIAMFGQAMLTPAAGDPSQKTQQQMMKYGMPLMFGVMSFWFPSGLTLYILTNTLLTAVQSIWLNKYDPKTKAIAATFEAKQAEIAAREAGKAKDANAKMPKATVVKADAGEAAEEAAVDAIVAAKPRPQQKKKAKKGRR